MQVRERMAPPCGEISKITKSPDECRFLFLLWRKIPWKVSFLCSSFILSKDKLQHRLHTNAAGWSWPNRNTAGEEPVLVSTPYGCVSVCLMQKCNLKYTVIFIRLECDNYYYYFLNQSDNSRLGKIHFFCSSSAVVTYVWQAAAAAAADVSPEFVFFSRTFQLVSLTRCVGSQTHVGLTNRTAAYGQNELYSTFDSFEDFQRGSQRRLPDGNQCLEFHVDFLSVKIQNP